MTDQRRDPRGRFRQPEASERQVAAGKAHGRLIAAILSGQAPVDTNPHPPALESREAVDTCGELPGSALRRKQETAREDFLDGLFPNRTAGARYHPYAIERD